MVARPTCVPATRGGHIPTVLQLGTGSAGSIDHPKTLIPLRVAGFGQSYVVRKVYILYGKLNDMKQIQISVKLDEEDVKRIDEIAKKHGIARADVVRMVIKNWLKKGGEIKL